MRILLFASLLLLLSGCLPTRYVAYNFAGITDYKKFPERPLPPAPQPYQFAKALKPLAPREITISGKTYPFEEYLRVNKTVAFLIIRNDTLLYEKYFSGYRQDSRVASFSMAKSFTSLLIGAAIQDGLIKSVDEPVTNYLPEMKDAGFDSVTIRHLLQMTSGLRFNENYYSPAAHAAAFYYGRHLRKRSLALKRSGTPGTAFDYTSGSTQLLGLILDRALNGKTITQYCSEKLWSPLQTQYPAGWSIDQPKNGIEKTFCCVNATAIDFAKVGKLMVEGGRFNGAPVIPEHWVRESMVPDTTAGGARFYKYQWWLAPGAVYANGHLGQFIFAFPEKKLIIVRLGKADGKTPWPFLIRNLAAAL
ncbi:MAG: class C beta-lactamase-related serine hydrolase [Sphingobacteriales bacterium]|nr:MAG: class C beta-lactamase-related serine hydrolase [Sphingobacteriales bacterium]